MRAHFPPGMPGSLSWKARQLGMPAYNFAMYAAGTPGTTGRQSRFYLGQARHRQLKSLARAAASQPPITL